LLYSCNNVLPDFCIPAVTTNAKADNGCFIVAATNTGLDRS
jgi:hypothetical protein